ncbi:MAG: T9SS type A sorting domain-containing protein [Saprospiraceae bacterium]|nr:T9SS type A sorting domain-containing protein [Saprospiraceae bacterium]
MKKLILFITISLQFAINGFGQIDSTIHGELRRLIGNLQRANCQSEFLYDLSAHTSNDTFYKIRSFDTSNTLNWFTIYDEMHFSAYNLGLIPVVKQVFDQAQEIINKEEIIPSLGTYQSSKIPLGLMDFEFNSIRPDAFDSLNLGRWYFWDDDSIWDNPSRLDEPFELNLETPGRGTCKEIFSFSPLGESSFFRNVTFTIDPSKFFFYGSQFSGNTLAHPNPHLFEIDFNDGLGWRVIDPYTYSEITVTYPKTGVYHPKARVTVDGQLIKHSLSTFTVESDQLMKLPDFVKWLPHLNIGVYKGCSNDSLLKPIVYLEGIDPLENRHIPQIYSEMLLASDENGLMPMLLNYDYDFVVVSWANSKQDMKINADAVVGLLDWLKTVSDTTHQFVVIGESMGGVIGRYALTYMETQDYHNRGNQQVQLQFKKWREHNTRLFISLDAPHQGAVIPLAFQHVNDWIYTVPRPIFRTTFFLASAFWKNEFHKNLLNQDAVKQLLVLHRNTRNAAGECTEHSMRTDFMNDLVALNPSTGGYPVHCKLMAISNGLIDGREQVGFRNRVIQPNDLIADASMFVGVKIFKVIPIPIFAIDDFKLRINPSGNGNIVHVGWRYNLGNTALALVNPPFGFLFTLRGCLTNIFKKKSSPCNILGVGIPFNVDVSNAIPWETFPGGTQSAIGRMMNTTNNKSTNKWLYQTLVDYDDFNGTILIRRSYGVRFLLSGNFNFSLDADVDDWCFIPLQSALDYSGFDSAGNVLPQNHDLIANSATTNISRTPFHIIMGWNTTVASYPSTQKFFRTDNGFLRHNGNHLDFRNDPIDIYPPFIEPTDHGIINREIGDVAMYLDNMNINREAIYQCENNIFAGFNQHPYYTFPSSTGSIAGLNSDNQKFVVDSFDIGEVVFKAGNEIRLRPGFESVRFSNFRAEIDTMFRCHYTIEELRDIASVPFMEVLKVAEVKTENPITIIVYPNPTCDNINWKSPIKICGKIQIFNATGLLLTQLEVNDKYGQIDMASLVNGVYYIVVVQNSNVQYFKIIKK